MRADRLLAMMILLQTHGRMTARSLAEELEVTERTIYRDLTSLSSAGVPVFTERGPGGGISLLDSYRTNLTGLSRDEIRAIFMLSIPAPLAELGVKQDFHSALLKLAASLPAARKDEEVRTRQRFLLDPSGWDSSHQPAPFLALIHQAVWEDRELWLRYEYRHQVVLEQIVRPYALVAKGTEWYLVYQKENFFRAVLLDHLSEVHLDAEHFIRTPEFDLSRFWRSWSENVQNQEPGVRATLRIDPAVLPELQKQFGNSMRAVAQTKPDQWEYYEIKFKWIEEARQKLLGFGGALEVLEPQALRRSMADFAKQISARYSG